MSDDENFLARWSRRKREAAALKTRDKKEQGAGEETRPDAAPAHPAPQSPSLDPAGLPPIESLGAGSDISPFLAPGVPADIARAALRRLWTTDPRIRDFIGLSENSWDFNAEGGVPGFGTLAAEQVHRLLAQLRDADTAATTKPVAAAEMAQSAGASDPPKLAPDAEGEPGERASSAERDRPPNDGTGPSLSAEPPKEVIHPRPRHHGGALPE